jgi:kinesin family protein 4/21/27
MQQPTSPSKTDKNWVLKATYVEIYNEQLRDLLIPDHVPAHERGNVTIREDVKGNIILTGLRQVEISSVDDLMNALNFGSTLRQTDATAINARSSRSHAVFSLNLVQRKNKLQSGQGAEKRFSVPLEAMTGADTWITTDSKMHFVDLAGSERLKNTGAQGERAKEGISINAGLAALGKVISQLSSRQAGAHVSYRDSKLTRLLQDSLGGNAITYMIACVTPPEFHLSETLNTVQYAQRARAIQSKPRIQQVEEGDKQAIIDRLKAEVAFLREQIRSAERGGGERHNHAAAGERSERQNEREVELQNQLLDSQENYAALSQRHAKLIAEMARARDNELAENHHLEESLDDSATARLNRSNSFAQAVEQVVLEYEKTIQSLEQSLSSTRTTLAGTETSLLEKESKCAYAETINTQLQARLQKLMDRESSTENYLQDLESKLDGHTSGEEKNAAIVMELRKEIARVRSNEAACEDYISTLEERLAEADQDAELMQRELERLEQVIERQRSLGKLDSLLYELDHIQQDGKGPEAEQEPVNGNGRHRGSHRGMADHSRSQSHVSIREDTIMESGEEDAPEGENETAVEAGDESGPTPKASQATLGAAPVPDMPTSPAQSKFVADKLETVTQELVGLKVEHENTLNEYDMLQAKYEEALRQLADLQDAVDEARHPGRQRDSMISVTSPHTRPTSFLSGSTETKDGARFSSSRSLSSELSSAMESPATMTDVSETDTAVPKSADDLVNGHDVSSELDRLKSLAAAKENTEKELAEKYAELESKHQETLDMVEELKTEVAKAHAAAEGTSPRSTAPVIRRKSSQNVMIIDRAHRSFAALRNIAAENFEGLPDTMQNFELNLNAAMHELHARSERIQELEADVASTKKEMETKMTIITGLTRERSSLKASPMDMAVVSNLREQLEKNDKQIKGLQDAHAARERELEQQLESLRETMNSPGEEHEANVNKIAQLEAELASWETKHQSALDNLQNTEQQMKKSVEDLDAQVSEIGQLRESEAKHQELVQVLRAEIEEHKSVITSNASKIAEVEQEHAATKDLLGAASSESDAHRELIAALESKIATHEEAVKSHQQSVQELQAAHDAHSSTLIAENAENLKVLEGELAEAREELMKIATQVAFALGLEVSVEKITGRIDDLIADQKALSEEQKHKAELEAQINELASINDAVMRDLEAVKTGLTELVGADAKASKATLPEQMAIVKQKVDELEATNKKNSRLVEELEDQLQTNFDQAQVTNNRLSALQTEKAVQLEELSSAKAKLQTELDSIKEEYTSLQVCLMCLSIYFLNKNDMLTHNFIVEIRGRWAERRPSADQLAQLSDPQERISCVAPITSTSHSSSSSTRRRQRSCHQQLRATSIPDRTAR